MRRRILQSLLTLMIPALMAVNLWAINNYNPPGSGGPPVPAGEPVDMSTGDNLVREEGLRLAAPGVPLSFDLHYNSGNNMPGILGWGWDLSLNWQLSLIYQVNYYIPDGSSKYYGAMLEKYLYITNGPLSAANADFPPPVVGMPLGSLPVKKNLLDRLFCAEILECFGPATATAQSSFFGLINKWFLISDGTRKYRAEGGWTNNTTGTLPDWDLNGGHYYFEAPVDWELVHTNNEYRLLFPGKKWLTFGDDGRMSAMGDAWGNTITRSRNGDTETWAHSNGRSLEFTYETYGTNSFVSKIQTDDNREMNFTYTTNGCLASVEWSGGGMSRIHYYSYSNDRHNKVLVERRNAEGTVSQYQYQYGVVYDLWSQYGYYWQAKETSMNVSSNWYRQTVSYSSSTSQMRYYGHGTNWAENYQFDGLGWLAGIIGPWNSSSPQGQQGEYYTYDQWRNIVVTRYFEGTNTAMLTNRYDDHHRPLEGAICNGTNSQQLWTATWSGEDRLPSSISNADGLKLNLEYTNGVVRRARIIRPSTEQYEGAVETLFEADEWDVRGMPGVVRDARGAETHLEFNADGQATTIQPPVGPGYGFDYDTAGRLQKVNRLEPGDVTRTLAQYDRDGFGQITNVTYPDGLTEHFLYDSMRRLIYAVDRAGRGTHLEYWPIGKVKNVKRFVGENSATVSFDYDEQGTDLKITDELGRVVEGYALDVAGRPTVVTNILGQTMQVTYALLDLPQQIQRFDNSTVSFTYDVAWRPASITYPDDQLNLTYSAGGLFQTISDGTGTILNKYDVLSRWAGQIGPHSWDEVTVVNGLGGLPESLTSVGGPVSYSYDIGSRLISISGPANTFNYSYNLSNGLIAGVSCATGGINVTYAFDTLDRVTDITWKDSSNNVVHGFDYDYNTVGMITQKVTTINGQPTTNSYRYDDFGRLIYETSGEAHLTTWSYDLAGNRTHKSADGTGTAYTVGLGNRLVSWGTNGQQQFDAAGNVTNLVRETGERLGLKWDGRYRLTSVTLTNGVEQYGYDALDRRISISDGTTTNFLIYNGIHCIADVDSSGNLLKSYTYGPGIDNILSMSVYTNSGGTSSVSSVFYYVKDHLGSVQAIVDTTGSIVESYQYDAWGKVLGVYDSSNQPITESTIGNRYLWQGREYSWATRLYYFRARWYDSVTGRWLSNDPIGIASGLNQYVFCWNNPANWMDPLGEAVYWVNREIGRQKTADSYISHSFIVVQHPDKSIETYSWGNTYDKNLNGQWCKNCYEDAMAALEAISYGKAKKICGESSLDPYIQDAYEILKNSSESQHWWHLFNNCKNEADKLIVLARYLQANYPPGYFSKLKGQ